MKDKRFDFKALSKATAVAALMAAPWSADATVTTFPQGWSASDKTQFYSLDQGSELMPLNWMVALKQADGRPFMADSLSRYGYLPNEASVQHLPIGFTVAHAGDQGQMLGMTCAACHTRQIEVKDSTYRIDGGPAIVDFQSFAADLDTAVGVVVNDDKAFTEFSLTVLGPDADQVEQLQLKADVAAWYQRYHTLMDRALPKDKPWGPSRLDAVSMIFNRLTGLDIGTSTNHIIPENIYRADAPVRYPFLWNAPIQDMTQWPGFADNGNNILGLARNLGEVYGVFGSFYPKKSSWRLLGVDYLHKNSADFNGLDNAESLIRKLQPPKWPWAVDKDLAAAGKKVFDLPNDQGGCVGCHGITKGKTRFLLQQTWATPILDVGTDTREYAVLARTVNTGVLVGAKIPALTPPLQQTDTAFNVLGLSVIGAILQHYESVAVTPAVQAHLTKDVTKVEGLLNHIEADISPFTPMTADLKGAFHQSAPQATAAAAPSYAYESRVLQGIWATAPYLHNGSVQSLADLLKPATDRTAAFAIGPEYDPVNVGLASKQTKFGYTLQTTDCSHRDSGDSRCGHEFGTQLSDSDKKALLEYLKTL
ncbi:hypothetical protein KFZ76_18745 [Methylovulum psychrotolerans]|uniref:di-heme-cytochrome C peroxidase n=1 Tax=Methylovulum psychrotolerans TaxID=1704499 RepID=UPI001BFF71F8|nr:di-heme-cytochrome C peroxidase [Methylovulum psychrotolerans]MBT9099739.1 hypothetical protein [Methylovulum psychrotolerans]